MVIGKAVMISMLVACALAHGKELSKRELARRLACQATREQAVAEIVSHGQAWVPVLVSLAHSRPEKPGIDVSNPIVDDGLKIGLAEAFGQLREEAGIPFLIDNIGLRYTPIDFGTWLKDADD